MRAAHSQPRSCYLVAECYSDDYDEYREDSGCTEDVGTYCEDCRVLTEALRDLEQQYREVEDERLHSVSVLSRGGTDRIIRDECAYLLKLGKLQRRRNFALEVLLKHQRLEHGDRS